MTDEPASQIVLDLDGSRSFPPGASCLLMTEGKFAELAAILINTDQ